MIVDERLGTRLDPSMLPNTALHIHSARLTIIHRACAFGTACIILYCFTLYRKAVIIKFMIELV